MVVVCGYPELYDTTSYFYKNRNKFSNETGAACRSPPHDANSRLLCSEFHANEASKLKMFKRPTTRDLFVSFASGVNAPKLFGSRKISLFSK